MNLYTFTSQVEYKEEFTMWKRIFSIILVAGLSFALFTGCQTKEGDAEKSTNSTISESAEAVTKTSDEAELGDTKEIEWSYSGSTGPEYWGSLDATFAIADEGKKQSPINIETANAVSTDEDISIQFNYQPTLFEVENNGHAIEAIPESDENTIAINNLTYKLAQFHLHSLSEHQIDGENYAMEIHLVHKSQEGDIAVIGLLVKEGAENEVLKEMLALMPTTKTSEETMVSLKDEIDLNALIPQDSKVFRYEGSLTTPPTSEGVLWSVYETAIELSAEQIERFQAIYSDNYRPVQDLNGRKINIY